MIKLNDFLKAELLGNKFVAIKGYSEVLDRETKKLAGYRINISLQDEDSDFYMEMITVKVNTTTPKISAEEMAKNKTMPIILQDLNVGQFDGKLWYTCTDVLPITTVK